MSALSEKVLNSLVEMHRFHLKMLCTNLKATEQFSTKEQLKLMVRSWSACLDSMVRVFDMPSEQACDSKLDLEQVEQLPLDEASAKECIFVSMLAASIEESLREIREISSTIRDVSNRLQEISFRKMDTLAGYV